MRGRVLAALAAAAAAAALYWQLAASPVERAIRQRFAALQADINGTGAGGLDAVARAARLSRHVTPDVVAELGQGSPPIEGRETLVAMASRLQPRTAAFVLELEDVTVEAVHGDRADVVLTALIRSRGRAPAEDSLDAREFSAEMQRASGEWRIARITAVDTLR